MKNETFDCVDMKRQGQRRLRELLKDMSIDQQIQWWRKRNEEFMREQERLRVEGPPSPFAPTPGA